MKSNSFIFNKIYNQIKFRSEKYPTHVYKSVLLNIFGIQVIRALFYMLYYKLKSGKYENENDKSLSQHGFTLIKNYLADEEYDKIYGQCQNLLSSYQSKDEYRNSFVQKNMISLSLNEIAKTDSRAKLITDTLIDSGVKNYAKQVLKKTITSDPDISLEMMHIPQTSRDIVDHNRKLHVDQLKPSCKMMYYLNDHFSENGTFFFCPDSHKMTLARIYYEYIHSIRTSYYLKKYCSEDFYHKRSIQRVTEPEHKQLQLASKQLNAHKNTLMVANTQGFHKRGEIAPGYSRFQINLVFYPSQTNQVMRGLYHLLSRFKK